MSSFGGSFSNGSIVLYVGDPPPIFFQADVITAGTQPADQKVQNYPQLRGFSVIADELKMEMGVHVDELTQ